MVFHIWYISSINYLVNFKFHFGLVVYLIFIRFNPFGSIFSNVNYKKLPIEKFINTHRICIIYMRISGLKFTMRDHHIVIQIKSKKIQFISLRIYCTYSLYLTSKKKSSFILLFYIRLFI